MIYMSYAIYNIYIVICSMCALLGAPHYCNSWVRCVLRSSCISNHDDRHSIYIIIIYTWYELYDMYDLDCDLSDVCTIGNSPLL